MRATKKTSQKNIAGKIFFISRNELFFRNRQQSNARWAEKNHMFFCNAQPKSNARAHLKQRKKHSGLMVINEYVVLGKLKGFIIESGG